MSDIDLKKDKIAYKKQLTSVIDVPLVDEAVVEEPVKISEVDAQGRAYATGRRKCSSARVWFSSGEHVTINNRKFEEYFTESMRNYALEPMRVVGIEKAKITATICGGGLSGQAGALRHGIARAIAKFDPLLEPILRMGGYFTRDDRKKERKTPGFRTARKPQQFSKR